ncbi:MAG: hypothetical protein IPO83_07730 [Chitinophagaceae bacterium]|nr:hypothetical protein [Chitinophagaceae bacterium]
MEDSKNEKKNSRNPDPFKILFKKKKISSFNSKHGILHNEGMNLFFKKLGITEDELKTINKKSLSFTRSMASKYSKLSEQGNKDIVNMLHHMIEHKDWPNSIVPLWCPFPPPGNTPLVNVEQKNFLQHASAHAEGNGTGLLTSHYYGNDDQTKSAGAEFLFPNLRVPVSGFYLIDVPIMIVGQYYLIADNGHCNSKEASCAARANGYITQQYNNPIFLGGQEIYQLYNTDSGWKESYLNENNAFTFYDTGSDINRMDTFALVTDLFVNDVKPVYLSKDSDISLKVYGSITAMGKGEGSVADINCEANSGGIFCPGVKMWQCG